MHKKILKALSVGYITKEQLKKTPREKWSELVKTPSPFVYEKDGIETYKDSIFGMEISKNEYERLMHIREILASDEERKQLTGIRFVSQGQKRESNIGDIHIKFSDAQ